ncbi:unnamed protein product [Polarella glacialis]|uniref:Uncharacterized protein n=1 Tax=Polarella glacialis TaxID=89957 RepID=A0A813HVZ6_POLGL|nr:unnamed protein product [Polarella glacialis]
MGLDFSSWSTALTVTITSLLLLSCFLIFIIKICRWKSENNNNNSNHNNRAVQAGVRSTPAGHTIGKCTPADLAEITFPEVGVLDEIPPASSVAAMNSMPAASAAGGRSATYKKNGPKSVVRTAGLMLKLTPAQLQRPCFISVISYLYVMQFEAKTLDGSTAIGTSDVISVELTGNSRSLTINFPQKYNVGNLVGGEASTPTATKDVKIKVAAVAGDAQSIYVDYLFDAADLQAAGKYFVYDPTVSEVLCPIGQCKYDDVEPSGGAGSQRRMGTLRGLASGLRTIQGVAAGVRLRAVAEDVPEFNGTRDAADGSTSEAAVHTEVEFAPEFFPEPREALLAPSRAASSSSLLSEASSLPDAFNAARRLEAELGQFGEVSMFGASFASLPSPSASSVDGFAAVRASDLPRDWSSSALSEGSSLPDAFGAARDLGSEPAHEDLPSWHSHSVLLPRSPQPLGN